MCALFSSSILSHWSACQFSLVYAYNSKVFFFIVYHISCMFLSFFPFWMFFFLYSLLICSGLSALSSSPNVLSSAWSILLVRLCLEFSSWIFSSSFHFVFFSVSVSLLNFVPKPWMVSIIPTSLVFVCAFSPCPFFPFSLSFFDKFSDLSIV